MSARTFADFGITVPRGAAGNVKTTCPRCSHERQKRGERCLSVDVERAVWHCHHCGWAGSLREASPQRAWRRPAPLPAADLPPEVLAWFEGRGITAAVVLRHRIALRPTWMAHAGAEVPAIAFPYFRAGELVNVKLRALDAKAFATAKDAEPILYGLDDLEPDQVVVVEGEMDKLALEVAGLRSCVSVPNGAPAPGARAYSTKFDFLDEPRLESVKEFVLACDADAPGQTLAEELARRLGPERCRRVTWPEGVKDANDALLQLGAEPLRELIAKAPPLPIRGVIESPAGLDVLREEYEHGRARGISTGWRSLDELYTVRPGELTVVTGIPNHGKSNFVDALLVNIAKREGWRFLFFSPENQPVTWHERSLVEKWTGARFFEGPGPRLTWAEVESTISGPIADHFLHFLPEDPDEWTIEAVLQAAKAMVRRRGIRGLVIDPWNELESVRPERMTETEYVSHVLKRVKQFARDNGVHVWLIAHPTKLYRLKDSREYPIPSLYDISGSANFANKADAGLVVWRTADSPEVVIHVRKVRFREIGRQGEAVLRYCAMTARYDDAADFKASAAAYRSKAFRGNGADRELPLPAPIDAEPREVVEL